jgi:hypothetical protein
MKSRRQGCLRYSRHCRHFTMLKAIAAEHGTSLRWTKGQSSLLAALRTRGQSFVFHKAACGRASARTGESGGGIRLDRAGSALDLAILATPRVVDQVLERKEPLLSGGEHKFLTTLEAD